MISAMNAAASGMEAQQTQIETISNNLANIETAGFKKSRTEFQDLLYETMQEPGAKTSVQTEAPVGIQRGLGVKVSGTQKNFEMGAPQHTKRPFDMMIRGEGFFMVRMPDGEVGYKRDGAFYKSAAGRLETIEGYPLEPEVVVPVDTKGVQISEDGTVWAFFSHTDRAQIGQVQVASFVNNSGLKSVGKNIFVETPGSGAPVVTAPGQGTSGTVMQYYLERSNVSPVEEMTNMITAQRAFEMNSKVITTVDSLMQHTVNLR
ncbi:MAG: flagellar basal-body rod protein FlgG [Bdellovibrionales bacterium]|nr:flagellar basal-body rod protein FlgG [Bdellovibrionales bacterium]